MTPKMKIVVAAKRVVDYNVKIRVRADGSGLETEHVKMSINPFDEIAVEEAVRLKEQGIASEIVVVSIGGPQNEETLRAALALGADRGVLVESPLTEPLAIAKILKKIVEQEQTQLVILGKQAIDDDCNQTGQMLAGLLNWPQGTFASKLQINGQTLQVDREVDQGIETLTLTLPAVITTDLRLNEPRYATLPNLMRAKQKSIRTVTMAELALDLVPQLEVLKVTAPPGKSPGIKVKNFKELMEKINECVADNRAG
jgi:electron transfer flavoprotein beta subunit